jgi:two-component system, NtrC family, nitrogen regulation response regulator NtrX
MKPHLKILCVDDNPDIRASLKDQFSMEDFEVDTAEDGEFALQKIKENNYDLILLDVKMPKMDGLTVLQEIRKLDKNPQVIMLSALSDVPTAMECVRLGAKDYISKPYDPEELLHIVIKLLGS